MANKNQNENYENYFIAYFDILGYEQKIKGLDDKGRIEFFDSIKETLEQAKNAVLEAGEGLEIELKMFSDNFFLCTKSNPIGLFFLVANIQLYFSKENIFVRGAMCHSKLIYTDDFIFGEGIVAVHYLEDNLAIFPRIIVDDSYIDGIEKSSDFNASLLDCFVLEDFYRLKVVDYLNYLKFVLSSKDINKIQEYLSAHKTCIVKNLKNKKPRINPCIRQKYEWCRNYHNRFCEENEYEDFLITDEDLIEDEKEPQPLGV
ncbi:MAG: hypothetical protein FWH20_06710 [Oscillospiraceae bacterium]|nr:hypothetical protein [Oscillospiraceae bacterium]